MVVRWGRSNPQKLRGLRAGERENRRGLRGVEGRLVEEERLEKVSSGKMDAALPERQALSA